MTNSNGSSPYRQLAHREGIVEIDVGSIDALIKDVYGDIYKLSVGGTTIGINYADEEGIIDFDRIYGAGASVASPNDCVTSARKVFSSTIHSAAENGYIVSDNGTIIPWKQVATITSTISNIPNVIRYRYTPKEETKPATHGTGGMHSAANKNPYNRTTSGPGTTSGRGPG